MDWAARILSCLGTWSGLWLLGQEAAADDGDWVEDGGVEGEVDGKCVLRQLGNQWCQVGNVLTG